METKKVDLVSHTESLNPQCLASLALFGELYSSKRDVYCVISDFIKEIIISEAKYSFTSIEMKDYLSNFYDFDLPEAVVKKSLYKLREYINKENGVYYVNDSSSLKSEKIDEMRESIHDGNDEIISNLYKYIESKSDTVLTEDQKESISHSFCSLVFDNNNGNEYKELISAFIVKNQTDAKFKEQIKLIEEGVVLYTGIKYNANNTNLSDVGSWKTPLTIFLDTDVLFHFGGLNGELYETIFNDFLDLVKEINIRNDDCIKLRYFVEVEEEINHYFHVAETIVRGERKIIPGNAAMQTIVNGCVQDSDVVSKKAEFFYKLRAAGIRKDEYDRYYDGENHAYNIIDENLLTSIISQLENSEYDYELDKIQNGLKFLNYVNIRRKGDDNNGFDHVRYIFLTGKTTIRIVAHGIKHIIPLATSLEFITSKFWYKLNKGFGGSDFPKTFDVLSKAQIVLSAQLSISIRKKYDNLLIAYRDGRISEEVVIAQIADLRSQASNPEDIEDDNVDAVLNTISEDDINTYQDQKSHYKNKSEKLEKENASKDEQIKKHQDDNKQLREKLHHEKTKRLSEVFDKIDSFEKLKIYVHSKKQKWIKILRVFSAIFLLVYIFFSIVFISKFDWNSIEPWIVLVIEILFPGLFMIIFLIKGRTWNIKDTFSMVEDYLCAQIEKQSNYCADDLVKYKQEIEKIEEEFKGI